MAERLTEYFENGAYTEKKNIIDVSDKVKFFENGCVMGKAIDKLAQLEDVMEKYHCNDIEELKKILGWLYTLSGKDIELMKFIAQERKQIHDMYCEIKKDRDSWKRACELACETLKRVMGKPLWIGGNIPAPEVKDTEYFYQQAKTESESK